MADSQYTKPELRERIKDRLMKGGRGGARGQWSARKAQLLAQEYEREGGGYTGKRSSAQKGLSKWSAEEWTTSDGKPAMRKDSKGREVTKRYLPKEAWDKLSDAEKKATNAKKTEGSRKGKQFVANTKKAKKSRKESQKT